MGGVWEWVSYATDSVRRNSPDVTPIIDTCRKGYGVGRAATIEVGSATGVVANTVKSSARVCFDYISDDQSRENLTRIATHLSKNTALYLFRSYGGGPIIDIVSRSVEDKKVDSQKERIKALEVKLAMLEKEVTYRKVVEQAEIPKESIIMVSKPGDEPRLSANMNQKPEHVLQMFMTKQFIGSKLLDDLIVPIHGRKTEKPISSSDGQHE